MSLDRRLFLQSSAAVAACSALPAIAMAKKAAAADVNFGFGLVTYMWGAEWDLPTLIKNCEDTGLQAVELRTTHGHKVEPSLTEQQRLEVRKTFENSQVLLVGIGSDERFDNPDPEVLKKAIERSKEFIRLSHDIGGSGVKVKPDKFHPGVPHEKTVVQIGKALNELGEYAAGFGQQVRLEIHGECAEIPTIAAIMKVATDDNVALCWNSNASDLKGEGLKSNFNLVRPRFGETLHCRELNSKDYPWQELITLLVKSEYQGYVLLEAASKPADKLAVMTEQVQLFRGLVAEAKGA